MTSVVNSGEIKWFHAVKRAKWKPLTDTWPEGTDFRLWHPQNKVDQSENISWFGGIDVHLKGLTAGIYGIDKIKSPERVLGPIVNFKVSDIGYSKLFELFDYFDLERILMETTGVYSFDPYYRCKSRYSPKIQETRVICMNAHDLSKLLVKNKKTDKVDTSRLAFLASVPELLRMSYIPTRDEYTLRLMLRQRNKYRSETSKHINRCKTLLSAWGLRWQFNFNSKGQMQLLRKFIDQEDNLGDFLHSYDHNSDIPKSLQLTLKTHKNKLLAWGSYATTDLERLILKILIGLKDKFEGIVKFYDKLIFEKMISLPRFSKQMELIKGIPGMGEWSLATILLETGPISRFPTVGSYLSYAGVTKGIEESADKSVKKGNNPHSHRILKQAYRTIGITILGVLIRAEKGNKDATFQQCHPLFEYAKKINSKPILNGKKANKIAAKAARIIYGILKSNKPYDTCHEKTQTHEQNLWKEKNKLVVRYSAFQRQIALLKTTYQEIAQKSTLLEEPFMDDLLNNCESIFEHFNREPYLKSLRDHSKKIRTEKNRISSEYSQKKKTSRIIHIRKTNIEPIEGERGRRRDEK